MKTILAALCLALFVGCSGPNLDQTAKWMDSHQEAPALNLAGTWKETSGWQEGTFSQSGSKVMGILGRYNFEGRISGNKVYAALTSGHRVYYFMVLEPDASGNLSGIAYYRAYPGTPESAKADKCPVILLRPKVAS